MPKLMKTTMYLEALARKSAMPTAKEVRKIISVWFEDLFEGEYLKDTVYLESINKILAYLDSLESNQYIEEALEYWQYMKRNKQHQVIY